MDNGYLLDLINETNSRGGGMVLSYKGAPAVVVLSVERYNKIMSQESRKQEPKGKVFVTGGAGYIGGHLVSELIKAGFGVVVLDNLSTGKKENLNPEAIFVEGDLADENLLADLFAGHEFEAVFHMAASLEVEESVREPEKYFDNNVKNTARLLKAMNDAGCKKIIFSSSAAVYGEPKGIPITENSFPSPQNPYGQTKLLAEREIKYYCENLGFKGVVFRYFNACGFNIQAHILPTHQSHLIYNVMLVAKGERAALQVYGNDYPTKDGTCVRDYVHVLDIVLPHVLALEKMTTPQVGSYKVESVDKDTSGKFEIYNIGTGRGSSVLQVVAAAAEVLNRIIPMEMVPRRPGDAPATVADNAKLLKGLGYRLEHSGLENIIRTSWAVMKDI